MSGGDEYEKSLAIAAAVLETLRAFRHAAMPRNYEVWYNYARASNPGLNDAINGLVATHRTVTQADIDALYGRLTEQIDGFGSRMMGEIDQIITVIDGTIDSTVRHNADLAGMSSEINRSSDLSGLRSVVGRLVQTAREIESANQQFEAHLKESREEINQLQQHLDAVRNEILTDPLTTLSNRKLFDQTIVTALAEAQSGGTALALVMADIDRFKQINDTFGHLTGDQVLRLVALSLKQNISGQAVAARYGGEEFAIILPGFTLAEATALSEQIRHAVMGRELVKRSTGETLGHVTISLGVSVLRPGDTTASLVERADTCLYAAKRNGRNRVVTEAEVADKTAKVA
jgi:diguanylate cyclase